MMDNTFFQERVVFRQQRNLTQRLSGLPHDQSHKSERYSEVEQVQGYLVRVVVGEYHLEEIQPVTEYQKYRHKSYRSIVAFGACLHEDQQRSHEVDHQVQIKDSFIGAIEPGFEINGLFRDVGVPDQHELCKPQVSPEDGKGELEFTQVM